MPPQSHCHVTSLPPGVYLVINSFPELVTTVPTLINWNRFPQSWADASQRAGLPYYPKLLVGVPFTPAAGARVLIDPTLDERTRGLVRKTVAMFLR